MRIDLARKLFAGVKIDNKLRDALANCAPRDRQYFDGSDPRYLRQLRGSPEEIFLGKVIDPPVTAVSMDDMKRNILSLLARLGGRRSEDDVKIWACDEGEVQMPPPEPPTQTPSPYERRY